MKKLLWMIVLIGTAGYAYQSYMNEEENIKTRHLERQQKTQSIKTAVKQMIARTNAVTDWESIFADGIKYRLNPILC